MRTFVIYRYLSPSFRSYIGLTCDEERRKKEHAKKEFNSDPSQFAVGIRKHGFINFTYEVLECGLSEEDAKSREIFYIEKFDSYKNGYNGTPGGDWSITRAKLTEDDVLDIRRDLELDLQSGTELSKKYNISESMISDIKNKKRWNHIKGSKKIKRTNRSPKGSKNAKAKLTEDQVRDIRIELSKGAKRSDLQKKYKITKNAIREIAVYNTWKHVIVPEYVYAPPKRSGSPKFTEEQVRAIWEDKNEGMSSIDIQKKHNIKGSTLQAILSGRNWKDIYEEMKE